MYVWMGAQLLPVLLPVRIAKQLKCELYLFAYMNIVWKVFGSDSSEGEGEGEGEGEDTSQGQRQRPSQGLARSPLHRKH